MRGIAPIESVRMLRDWNERRQRYEDWLAFSLKYPSNGNWYLDVWQEFRQRQGYPPHAVLRMTGLVWIAGPIMATYEEVCSDV